MDNNNFSCANCEVFKKGQDAHQELSTYEQRIKDLDDQIEKLTWLGVITQKAQLLRQRQQEVLAANIVQKALNVIDLCTGPLEPHLEFPTSETTREIIIRCGVEPDKTTTFMVPR